MQAAAALRAVKERLLASETRAEERAREDALREDKRDTERLQGDERVAELERAQVNSPTGSSTYCIVNY